MPAIMVHTVELKDEHKRIIADQFATILAELTKVPKERIYVFFNGYPFDSIGQGGTLVSDFSPKPGDFDVDFSRASRESK